MIKIHDHIPVMQVNEDILIKELEVSAELNNYTIKKPGKTSVVLNRVSKFINLLQKKGYMPQDKKI